MTLEQMAREFNAACGRNPPAVPAPDLDPVWLACLTEEVREFHDAATAGDIVEMADALADIAYVVAGAAVDLGLPFDVILAEVHRSNMTKFGPDGHPEAIRSDGKIVKGPSFEPPRIAKLLGKATGDG